jgi:hypothetical protein
MQLKPKKLPEYVTFAELEKQFCPDPETQTEKVDRIKRGKLLACRKEIKEVMVQACSSGELKCEGMIGGWKHTFLEQNPYPLSRPGMVNKSPQLTYEDFRRNDWLQRDYRLQQQRHDSRGREYGYVYYSDEHITISANEFKSWFKRIGRRLIDDLFDSPVKSIDGWWDDDEPRNPKKNDLKSADFLVWQKENPHLKPEEMTKAEVQEQLMLRNRTLWASGFENWYKHQHFFRCKSGRRPKPKPD